MVIKLMDGKTSIDLLIGKSASCLRTTLLQKTNNFHNLFITEKQALYNYSKPN
jgi:hypothetical protein